METYLRYYDIWLGKYDIWRFKLSIYEINRVICYDLTSKFVSIDNMESYVHLCLQIFNLFIEITH